MILGELFRMAFAAIWSHKLRSSLTLVGIIAGVASIIGVMTGISVIQSTIEGELSVLGSTVFQVQKWAAGGPMSREEWLKIMRRRPTTTEHADAIREKADQAIIDRVGRAFFEMHYAFDLVNSHYEGSDPGCDPNVSGCEQQLPVGNYMMVYKFQAPGKNTYSPLVGFTLKVRQDKIKATDFIGIPDCITDSSECEFLIDDQSAIEIAREAGLEKGLDEWGIDYYWRVVDPETYVWAISNTISANQSTGQSKGQTVVIDANSGNVIEVQNWEMMPSETR